MTVKNTEMARASVRPRVICHMMASVDGRIVTEGWPLAREGSRQYEAVHDTYEPDAWICGRVTMEEHFAAGTRPDRRWRASTMVRCARTSSRREDTW